MSIAKTQAISMVSHRAPAPRRSSGDLLLLALIGALGFSAWSIARLQLFRSGDDVGYWLGVAGGSLLLLLFVYPLRKYLRVLQRMGTVRWWFVLHMVLGIVGPWLILVHSNFRIGSLNGAVALICMLVVVASGAVGRFIYVRVHRGLHGERTTLRALHERAGLTESHAQARLGFAPEVQTRLLEFERRELLAEPGWTTHLRRTFVLPLQQWLTYRACVSELRPKLNELAMTCGWSPEKTAQRRRQTKELVRSYLNAVVRVAQFTAYERVFALWHVAHLPFVYLFVISALVHVVAVHAY